MEVETVWGVVKTRRVSTRLSKQEYVLLKDNPNLKPLFDWLKVCKVKTVNDFDERLKSRLVEALRMAEAKFEFVDDEVTPMLAYSNTVPLEGNFVYAVCETLKIFYEAMYNPERWRK